MAAYIVEETLANNTVYGIRQVQYAVDGESGKDYIDALTAASFNESVAIETAASSYVAVVKARQAKIDALGIALAEFAKAQGRLKQKGGKSGDNVQVDNYSQVKAILEEYGVSVPGLGSTMTRGNVQKAVTNVQYAIDKEDNSIQQDIVSMQSFVQKRDNAFSTAAKLVKKANKAAQSTISNIGG